MKERVAGLEEQLRVIKGGPSSALPADEAAMLQKELAGLREELATTKAQLTEKEIHAKSTSEQLSHEFAKASQELESLKQALAQVGEQRTLTKDEQLRDLESEAARLRQEQRSLRARVVGLETAAERPAAEADDARVLRSEAAALRLTLEERTREADELNATLRASGDRAEARAAAGVAALQAAQTQMMQLQGELMASAMVSHPPRDQDTVTVEVEMAKLQLDVRYLKLEQRFHHQQCEDLKKNNAQYTEEASKLRAELDEKEALLAAKEQELKHLLVADEEPKEFSVEEQLTNSTRPFTENEFERVLREKVERKVAKVHDRAQRLMDVVKLQQAQMEQLEKRLMEYRTKITVRENEIKEAKSRGRDLKGMLKVIQQAGGSARAFPELAKSSSSSSPSRGGKSMKGSVSAGALATAQPSSSPSGASLPDLPSSKKPPPGSRDSKRSITPKAEAKVKALPADSGVKEPAPAVVVAA